VAFDTDMMHPTNWSVGRQFYGQGPVGLLVDASRLAVQGAALSQQHGDVGLQAIFGMALYDSFDLLASGGLVERHLAHNDGLAAARLQWDVADDWCVGGNYLITGLGEENGWSVDVEGMLFDRRFVAEYARLTEDAFGYREGDDWTGHWSRAGSPREPDALHVSYDLWNTGCFNFTGYWSKVDFGFNPFYSGVNPYYELLSPRSENTGYAWERWLDNPLMAHNLEAIGGIVTFDVGDCPLELGYHQLLNRDLPQNVLADFADGNPLYE
ncbi:unnamed protein product, partial [marine sediment metagenome]